MKTLVIILALLAFEVYASGQGCLDVARRAMKAHLSVLNDSTWKEGSCKIITQYLKNNRTDNEKLEYVSGPGYLELKSNSLDVFADDSLAVFISTTNKMIFIRQVEQRTSRMSNGVDVYLKMLLQEGACECVPNGGEIVIRRDVDNADNASINHGMVVDSLQVRVDKSTNAILELLVVTDKRNGVNSVRYSNILVNVVEPIPSSKRVQPLRRIQNARGVLLSKYSSYTVRDYRGVH